MNSRKFQIILGLATLVILVITLLLTLKEGKRLLDDENDKPVVYAMAATNVDFCELDVR